MPKIHTKTGGTIAFRYEPGEAEQKKGKKVQVITITHEGVGVTADVAKVACAMYEEVELVERG